MHTNVYSEDMDMSKLKVVKKKGFTGLQIKFGEGTNEQLTFWHKNPKELGQMFDLMSITVTPISPKLKKEFAKSTRVR